MAKFTGWKKRYSYLDDYKKGLDGKYVYYGRHHILQGGTPKLRNYQWILGLTGALALALFIAGGFLNTGILWSVWYVVLPYALEAVCIFLFLWKAVTLLLEKYPVKSYIYKKTVPWFSPVAWILCVIEGISLIASGICMGVHTELTNLVPAVVYMILKLLTAALCLVFLRMQKGFVWEEDPSEEL